MDLTSEAIQKIVELSEYTDTPGALVEIHGVTYYTGRDGKLTRMVKNEDCVPDHIKFTTLSGLTGYIATNIDKHEIEKSQIVVESPQAVRFVAAIQPRYKMSRNTLAVVNGPGCEFTFGKPGSHIDPWYRLTDFIIALQSQFMQDENTEKVIGWLGNLANEKIMEKKDDGFSQAIQVKTGITTRSNVKIENPVTLSPFRTFREIEQPSGTFVLRLKESKDGLGIKVALFAADGGAWELTAMDSIKTYLEDRLSVPVLC